MKRFQNNNNNNNNKERKINEAAMGIAKQNLPNFFNLIFNLLVSS